MTGSIPTRPASDLTFEPRHSSYALVGANNPISTVLGATTTSPTQRLSGRGRPLRRTERRVVACRAQRCAAKREEAAVVPGAGSDFGREVRASAPREVTLDKRGTMQAPARTRSRAPLRLGARSDGGEPVRAQAQTNTLRTSEDGLRPQARRVGRGNEAHDKHHAATRESPPDRSPDERHVSGPGCADRPRRRCPRPERGSFLQHCRPEQRSTPRARGPMSRAPTVALLGLPVVATQPALPLGCSVTT